MEPKPPLSSAYLSSLTEIIGPFYFVGGYVRDLLMRRRSRRHHKGIIDIDIAVDSPMETVRERLAKGFFSNREKMTLTFFWKGLTIDLVSLNGLTIDEELTRRDLTINSMGLSCQRVFDILKEEPDWEGSIWPEDVIDPTGGWSDLRAKILRCPREKNLTDDPVRLVRVFRFQGEFGFEIEDLTFQWIHRHAPTVRLVAKERVARELEKLFSSPYVVKALRELKKTRLFRELFPLLTGPLDRRLEDRPYFGQSVFEHSLRVIAGCGSDPLLRWAGLFHETGTRDGFSCISSTDEETAPRDNYRPEERSVELFHATAEALGLPKRIVEPVEKIIRFHQVPATSRSAIKEASMQFREPKAYNRFFRFVQADRRAADPLFLETDEGKAHKEIVKAVRRMMPKIGRCERFFSGKALLALGLRPTPAFKVLIDHLMKKARELDYDLTERTAQELLESTLRFRERYERLFFDNTVYRRKREYYIDGEIIGVLEEDVKLTVHTEVFLYRFEPEVTLLEALRGKNPLLFFSLSS